MDGIRKKYVTYFHGYITEFGILTIKSTHTCRTGPGEFPTQRAVTRRFDIFFDLRLIE